MGAYTGPFMEQPLSNLNKMLTFNIGATAALCRLFGEGMAARGRGRILLVGAPPGASPGVAGACAFGGSMAFVRALADGLRQELAPAVGVSCLESRGIGREQRLEEALAETCVSFLARDRQAPYETNRVASSPVVPVQRQMNAARANRASLGSVRLDSKAERNFSPVTKEEWSEAY